MPSIGSLLGILAFRRSVSNHPLFREFLSGMTVFLSLIVASGLILVLLLAGGLYLVYLLLIGHGLEQQAAMITVGAFVLCLAGAIAGALRAQFRHLQRNLQQLLRVQSPLTARINDVTDAFVDGLLDSPPAA